MAEQSYSMRTALLIAGGVALLVLGTTSPRFGGDWVDYSADVASVADEGGRVVDLLEPGHLVWRPLGVALAGRSSASTVDPSRASRRTALNALRAISIAGFILALAAAAVLLRSLNISIAPMTIGILGLALSNSVVNFAMVGTPYVPALAVTLGAMAVGWPCADGRTRASPILAGALLALATALWLPFGLAAPAVLLGIALPLSGRPTIRPALRAAAGFMGITAILFVGAGLWSGVNEPAEWVTWVGDAGHGIESRPSAAAVVGGFPRSLVFMGDDLRYVKRFLHGDSLNPVTMRELLGLRASWVIPLFYASMAIIVLGARRTEAGRRALLIFATAAIPVVGFAWLWQGGDLERYMAMFPFLLVLAIVGLGPAASRSRALLLPLVACGVLLGGNWWAYSKGQVRESHASILESLECIQREGVVGSLVVLATAQDPLVGIERSQPSAPIFDRVRSLALVVPGLPSAPEWRSRFRLGSRDLLRQGGEVWVSGSLFRRPPPLTSGWIEGLVSGVTWEELRGEVSQYDYGMTCGPGAAFRRLPATQENLEKLESQH